MTNETKKKILAGFEDGLLPSKVLPEQKNGIALLKNLRKNSTPDEFRQIMRMMVMPNRLASHIERTSYFETVEEVDAAEARCIQAFEEIRERLKK